MKLKTVIRITKPYSGKSKFEFFKSLKEGDLVMVHTELEKPGRNSGAGLYASQITLY